MSRSPTVLSILPSHRDRIALTVVLVAAGAALAAWAAGRSVVIGAALPVDSRRVATVKEKIDPNTASAPSLRRLAGISDGKAEKLIRYRAERREQGDGRPFRWAEDLTAVPGIGPATVARLAPHLTIPRRGDPGDG